jgi:hypothetical protein
MHDQHDHNDNFYHDHDSRADDYDYSGSNYDNN